MTQHIGEDAALYALGLLDDREQAAVDEHIEQCDACRHLLAQAYDDVASMAAAQPQLKAPAQLDRRMLARSAERSRVNWLAPVYAFAAALVIGILPSVYFFEQNLRMHQAMLADADVMARIASSPHRAAQFTGMPASVMYGSDGSWYFVVVRGAKKPMHVAWMHDGTKTMLGTAMPRGDIAVLYLPKSHRMDQLAIVADDRMVAQARLVF